jgi:uncharacterized membrane protein
MGMKPRTASAIALIILPMVLSVIALGIGGIDNEDLPIRMNTEHLLEQREFRTYEGSFNGRPVYRLQGFEFISAIIEGLSSKGFAVILMMALFSLSAFIVYLISLKTTQSPAAALFSVLLIGSSPIFLASSLSYHEVLFALPLIMFCVYLFMQGKMNITALLFSFLILTFMNLAGAYLIIILLLYLAFKNAIGSRIGNDEREAVIIVSSILIGVLTVFFLFFREHTQLPIFYNNLPGEMIAQHFSAISMLARLFSPGLIVILLSAVGAYYIVSRANEKAVLPFSMLIAGAILSIVSGNKVIIAIYAASAAIVASHGISVVLQWISISKLGSYKKWLFIIIGIVIVASGIAQAMIAINEIRHSQPSFDEMQVYEHIAMSDGTIIFTMLQYSEKAEYHTGKSAFIRRDFTGVDESDIYYNDYTGLIGTRSSVEAIRLVRENGIDFLMFRSDDIPFYLREEVIERRCFVRNDFGDYRVYDVICGVAR